MTQAPRHLAQTLTAKIRTGCPQCRWRERQFLRRPLHAPTFLGPPLQAASLCVV
ncbi:MAG: hypothetical protein ACK6AD_06780 [Cyanobacteriota bacterium]